MFKTGGDRAYPLVPRYEQTGVRRRPYENYLVFIVLPEHGLKFCTF
jgi:hypothetical protein